MASAGALVSRALAMHLLRIVTQSVNHASAVWLYLLPTSVARTILAARLKFWLQRVPGIPGFSRTHADENVLIIFAYGFRQEGQHTIRLPAQYFFALLNTTAYAILARLWLRPGAMKLPSIGQTSIQRAVRSEIMARGPHQGRAVPNRIKAPARFGADTQPGGAGHFRAASAPSRHPSHFRRRFVLRLLLDAAYRETVIARAMKVSEFSIRRPSSPIALICHATGQPSSRIQVLRR